MATRVVGRIYCDFIPDSYFHQHLRVSQYAAITKSTDSRICVSGRHSFYICITVPVATSSFVWNRTRVSGEGLRIPTAASPQRSCYTFSHPQNTEMETLTTIVHLCSHDPDNKVNSPEASMNSTRSDIYKGDMGMRWVLPDKHAENKEM